MTSHRKGEVSLTAQYKHAAGNVDEVVEIC